MKYIFVIIWGMCKNYSTLEVCTILADVDFDTRKVIDHLHIVLKVNASKIIDKSIMSELSAKRRKIGCMCILDDGCKELVCCLFA